MLEVKAQHHQMVHRTVLRDFIFPEQQLVEEILACSFAIEFSTALGTGFDFSVLDVFNHKDAS